MNTTQLTELILTSPARAYRAIVTTQEIDTIYCEILAVEEENLHVGNNGDPLTMHDYQKASQNALRKLIYRIGK
jgi:hypothetical protein